MEQSDACTSGIRSDCRDEKSLGNSISRLVEMDLTEWSVIFS